LDRCRGVTLGHLNLPEFLRKTDYASVNLPPPARPEPTFFDAYVQAFRATFLSAATLQHDAEYQRAYDAQRRRNQAGQIMAITGGAVGAVTSGLTAASSIEVLTRLDTLIGQVEACRETFGSSAAPAADWGW
jgi:hypothetical protein